MFSVTSLAIVLTLSAAPSPSRTQAAAVIADGASTSDDAIDGLLSEGQKGLWALNALAKKSRGQKKARLLEAIGHFRTEEAEYVLRRAVRDARTDVKVGALRGMGHLKTSRVARVLVDHLSHRDQSVRDAAYQALVETGPSVRDRVRPLLRHGNPRVRRAALGYIVEHGTDIDVNGAVREGLEDGSEQVQREAIVVLQKRGGRQFARHLLTLVKENHRVAVDAAKTFVVVAPPRMYKDVVHVVAGQHKNPAVWKSAAEALLARNNRRAFGMLADAAVHASKERRAIIFEMMTRDIDADRAAQLVGLLRSRRPGVSKIASEMLVDAGPLVEDGALRALPNASIVAKKAIAKLLVDAPRERVEAKVRALFDSEDSKQQITALYVFEQMKDPLHVPMIAAKLQSKRADVRIAAVSALGGHDVPGAVDAMIAALSDPNPDVRSTALDALMVKPTPARVEAVCQMLEADRQSTRLQAIRLLSPPKSSAILRRLVDRLDTASDPERVAIITGISKSGLPGADLLMIDLVTHRERAVRMAAGVVVDKQHAFGSL